MRAVNLRPDGGWMLTVLIGMSMCLIGVSAPAAAQDSGAGALEEIVVTAQRRTQSLQEVPISISVFNSDALRLYNVTEAQDYLALAPNVHFSEEGELGSRSIRVAMRGIANLGASDVGADPVSIFYDDVNINVSSQGTANPMLNDIERVEVLRGPQGTYFGASASGGALNVVSRKPTEDVEGEVELGFGNYGALTAGAILNAPLSDTVFARAVAYYDETPGVVENVNPVGSDSSSKNKDFRFSLRWLPTDRVENVTVINYSRLDQNIQELVATGVLTENTKRLTAEGFEPIDDGLGFYPDDNERYVNSSVPGFGGRQPEYVDTKSLIASNKLTYSGGGYRVELITGYIDTGIEKLIDQDHVSGEFLIRADDINTESWSQEFRLSSDSDGALEWIVGGIYMDTSKEQRLLIQTDELGFGPFSSGFPINRRIVVTESEGYALFGDVTWRPSDRISISGGLRYSHDKAKTALRDTFNGRPPNIPIPLPDQEESVTTNDIAPRVSVNFDFSDELTGYGIVSKGYRPGGVRLNPGTPPGFFDKEALWNYEVGLKGMLFNRRLQLGLALFYMDWKDAQYETSVFLRQPDGEVIAANGTENGDAESRGVELEFTGLVTDELTISGAIGYLDTEFGDLVAQASGVTVDLTGQELPQAPEWTMNFAANYQRAIPNTSYTGFVQVDWNYRDSSVANLDAYVFLAYPPGTNPYPYVNPSYDVTNLRFGIENEKFSLMAYVENVFDDNYFTGARVGVLLNGVMVRPHPRLYGIKAQFRF